MLLNSIISIEKVLFPNMTDAKTIEEMRIILKRVLDRSKKDNVGVYEAADREGIPKSTYYSYKKEVETYDRMMQIQAQPKKEEIPQETPEYPGVLPEEVTIPEKRKHKPETRRVNIDLPLEVYDYIEKEHKNSTLSIKAMCQKMVIDYVNDKKSKNERLFRL